MSSTVTQTCIGSGQAGQGAGYRFDAAAQWPHKRVNPAKRPWEIVGYKGPPDAAVYKDGCFHVTLLCGEVGEGDVV